PHDVILFRSDVMERVRANKTLRIGTCSVRRQINTADFLRWALPACDTAPQLEFLSLRGPVDERVRHIAQDASEPLDAVVIALAGLERLWQDAEGREAIRPFLTDARWMVMPLSEAPAAAAQGALAVESRADNDVCRALLQAIHDPATEQHVQTEQGLLSEHGEAASRCGATVISHAELGYVAYVRGRSGDGSIIRQTRTANAATITHKGARRWSGTVWQQSCRKQPIPGVAERTCKTAAAVFVAHADALTGARPAATPRYWTSGPSSWRRLAEQGIWVEGCADDLGFESVRELLQTPVLQLPALEHWAALTHRDATDSWSDSGIGNVVATYAIDVELDEQQTRRELAACTHFYWSSARQYRLLRPWLPAGAHHACGSGKTLRGLRASGLSDVQPFVSRREWQQWAA
ncbi:MAG: hypothetical protein KJP03_00385, partial [Gammaproteobacteria bacterium]|nr:hypothetical protein [Gammaproteobacteria bacterium]